MFKFLFDHRPAFVIGEFLLALALITFVVALVKAVVDRADRGQA